MDRGYDTHSPIQKKSSLPRTFALFRVYILSTLFLFALSFSLVVAYAPLFHIRSIIVEGSVITPNENIQIYVTKIIEGNIRNIFPFDSSVSIPVKTLEKNIKDTFSSVASVHIDRVGLSQIYVYITERMPTQVYCKNDKCVLIDEKGIVFTTTSRHADLEEISGSPAEFLRRSSTVATDRLGFGEPLLPLASQSTLDKVRNFLINQGFIIKKTSLLALGFFDMKVTYRDSQTEVEFRFRETKKLDEQIGELQLAFDKGLRQKIIENTVEYVISYVPQKVIYKNTDK